MLGPYLEEHPRISTYFVKALINLDPVERIRALQQVSFVKNRSQLEATATTAKMKMEIKWGLPFLPSELVMIYTKINHTSWHPYSVGMGLVNLVKKKFREEFLILQSFKYFHEDSKKWVE